ncbi:MAG: 5,10-methylenetetrahydrofolate reductase [Proteobacteria bacterium]|nr:MAG: 5,10-methylenetetrahydrofolate reductase [Pseudomonadota bacterium]
MLKDKIKNKQSGILLYGLTPPKLSYGKERIGQISQKQIKRINALDIDGVILYDVQDEISRSGKERPFSFLQSLAPEVYAKEYLHVDKPKIIYRVVGKYKRENFCDFLANKDVNFSVFVGTASKDQKVNLSMDEAYKLRHEIRKDLILGGVAIAERHKIKKDEPKRIFNKMQNGCEFFVTQAVYDRDNGREFLDDYVSFMKKKNHPLAPIILTLTPCGTLKTLEFMKWLGISIPKDFEEDLKNSSDFLGKSVKFCQENFKFLYDYGKKIGVPIGCNVESVAVTRFEIETSVELLRSIKKIMNENK